MTSSLVPEGAGASCFIEHLRVLHRLEFDAVRDYYAVAQSKFDLAGYMVHATDLYFLDQASLKVNGCKETSS